MISWTGAKSKVDIIARKKERDANNEIYYATEQEQKFNNTKEDQ